MDGKRSTRNIAYDYSTNSPKPSPQNYSNRNLKNEEGGTFYRNEYDNYNNSLNYPESPRRGITERRPNPSRRIKEPNQTEKHKFDQTQANNAYYASRKTNPTHSQIDANERAALAQPTNQIYESVEYGQMKTLDERDYNDYEDNENEYFTIGDYARRDYEDCKTMYDDLNQVVEEGDYISIIEDQYSSDEEGSEGYNYTEESNYRPPPVNSGDAVFGEPFNPAYYGPHPGLYEYEPDDTYEPAYYSASSIPTANPRSYAPSYHQYQRTVPNQNPESNSCPVLPNNINHQKRKDIFKQVSKKINETVAELRNAGIEEKAEHIKESNPSLDYIQRFNEKERRVETIQKNSLQPRTLSRVNVGKPQSLQMKSEALERKIQQQQQQQIQYYREMMQKKRMLEANNRPPGNPGVSTVQHRYISPQRPRPSPPHEQEGISTRNNSENENFSSQKMNKTQAPSNEVLHRKMMQQLHNEDQFKSTGQQLPESAYSHYQRQQQDSPCRDGHKTVNQQMSEHNRQKRDTQRTESFVQLHGVSDQTVLDCCRQVYDDYKKTSCQELVYK